MARPCVHEASELVDVILRILEEDAPLEALEHGRAKAAAWHQRLGRSARVEPDRRASGWVRDHAERIVACLPASGGDLPGLAHQLRLSVP